VNKSELIDAIAASADIPKAAAGRALESNPSLALSRLATLLFWLVSVPSP
jgi:nucleoid DNA-binding protein